MNVSFTFDDLELELNCGSFVVEVEGDAAVESDYCPGDRYTPQYGGPYVEGFDILAVYVQSNAGDVASKVDFHSLDVDDQNELLALVESLLDRDWANDHVSQFDLEDEAAYERASRRYEGGL